jgi:hypothetical protein
MSGTLLLFAALPIGGGTDGAAMQPPDDRASRQFEIWTGDRVPAGVQQRFAFSINYPSSEPAPRAMPWDGINFRNEPERYLREVLRYCLDGAEADDFVFRNSTRWFHAPWLSREPVRGLTSERPSAAGELWPGQPGGIQNYAVGYYNDYGGWTIGQVWRDRGNPATAAVRFPVGTVSCKLLFTTATTTQVPYLNNSLTWQIAPGGTARSARLLQFDVAVRDRNADRQPDGAPGTGWVFGTFVYLGDESGATRPFRFADLTPVGLMWGNDPGLGPIAATAGTAPVQGWLNPVVRDKFREIRRRNPRLSTNLGLYGRVNGPVDNPSSACLACHGRALDGGPGWTSTPRGRLLPFTPSNVTGTSVANDRAVRNFFRNLAPSQPFLANTAQWRFTSLDYSLQLAVGLENFHRWRAVNPAATPFGPAAAPVPWMRLVPDAAETRR